MNLEFLALAMLPELAAFWREAFPSLPMTDAILRERIYGPEDAAPARSLITRGAAGEIIGISLLVPPEAAPSGAEPGWSGLRAFGVHPGHRRKGLGSALLEESCARLRAMGARSVAFMTTPPFYIQPGADARDKGLIDWLSGRGFERGETHLNMTVDLAALALPTMDSILARDAAGFSLFRAAVGDLPRFREFCEREFTRDWAREAGQAPLHEPSSLFLAERGGEVVGFAAYEANQALGCFGPTGVAAAQQGRGLGRRLLLATLIDMRALGRDRCEIGWIGPAEFYAKHAGAKPGPEFWEMQKKLT